MVELEYELFDPEGTRVETSGEDGPIAYLHGYGEILLGLERALDGAEAGSEIEITLPPDEAYGDYQPDGLVGVPRTEFPPDAEIVPGDWITVRTEPEESDGDDEGDEIEMHVVEIRPDTIFLDANHPLAGKDVTFKVRVLTVRHATQEEIAERDSLGAGEEE